MKKNLKKFWNNEPYKSKMVEITNLIVQLTELLQDEVEEKTYYKRPSFEEKPWFNGMNINTINFHVKVFKVKGNTCEILMDPNFIFQYHITSPQHSVKVLERKGYTIANKNKNGKLISFSYTDKFINNYNYYQIELQKKLKKDEKEGDSRI
jgi:hypothetical protein